MKNVKYKLKHNFSYLLQYYASQKSPFQSQLKLLLYFQTLNTYGLNYCYCR